MKILSKTSLLCGLILGLKVCINLGFPLSEHDTPGAFSGIFQHMLMKVNDGALFNDKL
jgi:hypothetical protein